MREGRLLWLLLLLVLWEPAHCSARLLASRRSHPAPTPRLTPACCACCARCARCSARKRVFLLDHDGTLVQQSSITSKPSQDVLK